MPGIPTQPRETSMALVAVPDSGGNSSQGSQDVIQPRQPASLQGLLRFAMEATKMEGAPNEGDFQQMDDERKQFLENALKSMTVNVIEILQKQIAILKKVEQLSPSDDISSYEEAMDTILEYIDNVDIANDFHKIGGFMILYPCLKCPHPRIRAGGCELLAVLCQNNPYCQQVVLDNEFIPCLIKMLENDADVEVTTKALYALSCIVRDCPEGFNQLIHYNGLAVLLKSIATKNDKLITKATFLLSSLCRSKADLKSRLIFLDYLPVLIDLIANERQPSHEHVLSLLVSLVEENCTAIVECKNVKYNLKEVLQSYLSNIRNKEECLEEEQYCKRLLHLLFSV